MRAADCCADVWRSYKGSGNFVPGTATQATLLRGWRRDIATADAIVVGEVLHGVMDGSIRVSNSFGTLNRDIGFDHDYSHTLHGRAPEGLFLEPAALR